MVSPLIPLSEFIVAITSDSRSEEEEAEKEGGKLTKQAKGMTHAKPESTGELEEGMEGLRSRDGESRSERRLVIHLSRIQSEVTSLRSHARLLLIGCCCCCRCSSSFFPADSLARACVILSFRSLSR